MTDEQPITEEPEYITTLRNEFQEQFSTLKSSFEAQLSEKDTLISKLQEENDALHRSMIRTAMTSAPSEQPKTEEELYKERISALADKTLQYMRN